MFKKILAVFAALVLLAAVAVYWLMAEGDLSEGLTRVTSDKIRAIQAGTVAPVMSREGAATAYTGATLIDGTGGAPVPNAVVLINGNQIVAAGADIAIPEGTEVVDASGKWITPGLIDAHVHFMVSGRIYTRPAMIDLQHVVPYDEEVKFIQRKVAVNLRSYTCAGVTGGVSMGGPSIEFQARAAARTMDEAPTIFTSHGVSANMPEFVVRTFFPLWDGELALVPVQSPEAAVEFVREAAELKADVVKFAYDYSGSKVREWMQAGTEEIVTAMTQEAARLGLKVTAHIHQLEPGKRMMEVGADSLQHIPADAPVDEEFIALAKENDVIVVPTISLRIRSFQNSFDRRYELTPAEETCADPDVIRSWYEVDEMPGVGDDRFKQVIAGNETAFANVKSLYDAGVTLAVGTDAALMGMPHGSSMHFELKTMNEVGIPAEALIVAATLNSAKVAGREDEYGSVEAGKFADFLVLSKNPLADIANLQAIDLVVKHGKPFRQQDLLPPQ